MVAFLPEHLAADFFLSLMGLYDQESGLDTLDHLLCVCCKATWSSLTHALIWCSCWLG